MPSLSRPLEGQVALVTGASRGIGRGIALQLADAGTTVYITGRQPRASYAQPGLPSLEQTANEITQRGGEVVMVYCDHAKTDDVRALFERIDADNNGKLDVLVNNAFAGAEAVLSNVGRPFFECEPSLWDEINDVGLRGHYICAVYASRLMTKRRAGLIVNVSSAGGLQYMFNVSYGVGKAALDRMSADMAVELKPFNVTIVTLWPGFVRTELSAQLVQDPDPALLKVMGFADKNAFERFARDSESPEFVGKAVVALARDRNVARKSGKILISADLASEYRFRDTNQFMPANMRSVRFALEFFGWPRLARLVPAFIKLPKFALHFAAYKF